MVDDPYVFLELDQVTRELMLGELDLDIETHGHLYRGKTLTDRGVEDYAGLMRDAISNHHEVWLTKQLTTNDRIAEGSPIDAARRLARTEFNRYYIRGICRRAELHGTTTVIPYRAHESRQERADSLLLENEPHSAPRILATLRGKAESGDIESGLGRVNSGLSARCGCDKCTGA